MVLPCPENGHIVFVDNKVAPATGTISLRAQFDNEDGLLVPSVFVNVEIGDPETSVRNVIPQATVQKDQQGDYVFVVGVDNQVEQRFVQRGALSGIDVVVNAGLEPGETVVVDALQRVRIGQPVALVISRLITLVGLISYLTLPVEKFPDITPLEEKINGVDDMHYMSSPGIDRSINFMEITFTVGTDPYTATVNVQNRVAQANGQLPAEVVHNGVSDKKSSSNLLLLITLSSEDNEYDEMFLSNDATINFNDVQFQYTVKARGLLDDLRSFENIVMRSGSDGAQVTVGDEARVELGSQFYEYSGTFNGRPTSVLGIYQAPAANALAVSDAVEKELERLDASLSKGIKYAITYNNTDFIKSSINDIIGTLMVAFALVLPVSWQRPRNSGASAGHSCLADQRFCGLVGLWYVVQYDNAVWPRSRHWHRGR